MKLFTVHTGDYISATVAEFVHRLSPFPAIAEFGDYSRQCGQGLNLLKFL